MESVSETSIAISDGFLALTAIHAAYKVFHTSFYASVGFIVIGVAACFGVARFSTQSRSSQVVSWHKYVAWLASVVGLPLVGCGYTRVSNSPVLFNILLASSVATVMLQKHLQSKVLAICGDVLGGLSLLIMLIVSTAGGISYGILGVVLYVSGSLLLKYEPKLGGIKTVDLFHYALMFGNIALMLGLIKEQKPLYYKAQ